MSTTSRGDRPPSEHVAALVSEAALRLDEGQGDLARDISDLIMREIKSLDVDQTLVELLRASVDGNTRTITHILINHIPIERLQPTTAAVEYALRLAQREIPSNSLVRAYSVGKDDFLQRAFTAFEEMQSSADRVDLAVALNACHLLGRAVLTRST